MRRNPLRVLIADDHEIVREGLRMVLAEEPEIAVVGVAASGAEAVTMAVQFQPDVVLMDLIMPEMDGIQATRRIRETCPACKVVVLTSFTEAGKVREALQAGAIGYLLKDVMRTELLRAIRDAADGRPTLHPEVQRHLIQQVVEPTAPPSLIATLTERERDVLRLIAAGQSNKEIAASLGLTEGTIKGYVSAVLVKLDVADRTQAALYAVRHGFGSDDSAQVGL